MQSVCSAQGLERTFCLVLKRAYRDARNVGRQRLEVVEGGCGVPDDEVDRDEEAAEDDAEGAADDGEQDVLLEEDRVPRVRVSSTTRVIYIASRDRRACNQMMLGCVLKH